MRPIDYPAVMARKAAIIKRAVGLDYAPFERGDGSFDYEALMASVPYDLADVRSILAALGVGQTPLLEVPNITRLARQLAAPGKGARILIKDEAQNPSGSYKARRAALSVYEAKRLGYKGVLAATSGNYGAAVACMAAKLGLKCIIVQECFDSRLLGQPEILEKQRKCEALGAEVVTLSVGPELFYESLKILEETGYYDASLYTPTAIAGVESLGAEIIETCEERYGKAPECVVVTNAGGGNLTGTARGMQKAGALESLIYAASVDLSGLHMASDRDFNRKSFTTGHTGFGIPFAVYPDRTDVPRSAARPLRYMDRYLLLKQGEVFYMTEALAALEGLERGPAGNISLAAAFALAQHLDEDALLVVQETEYTGAGKHPMAQLNFAKANGIKLLIGDPETEVPGESIVLPAHPRQIALRDYPMEALRRSALKRLATGQERGASWRAYAMEETRASALLLQEVLDAMHERGGQE